MENPAEARGIVKRAVTQVIGPGLPYDIDKSDGREHYYIACASHCDGQFSLALLDYTTGDFWGCTTRDQSELVEKLALHAPREFICYLGQWECFAPMKQFVADAPFLTTHLGQDYFDEEVSAPSLQRVLGDYRLDGILKLNPQILPALAALSFYICSTQKQQDYHHIRPFRMEQEQGKLKISLATLKGIEILPKSKETYRESLLGFFDRTKSAVGARELKGIFLHPLADLEQISHRQEWVQRFVDDENLLGEVREQLAQTRDLERVLVKLTRGRILAADLLNLSRTITLFLGLKHKLRDFPLGETKGLKSLAALAQDIATTINDELGAHLDKGNLIRSGANRERDRLHGTAQAAHTTVARLEQKYRTQFEMGALKIKHNNVLGHFIEISKAQAKKAPAIFHRKQTLVNCERFTSDELHQLEGEVLRARDRLQKLEREILQQLLDRVSQRAESILAVSKVIGHWDALSTLAWVALKEDFCRPELHPDRQLLHVVGGRHPLVLAHQREVFVPHHITLDQQCYFALITGPNMAGKTTVMREMAIIQFLAQVGSFVPAEKAELGICDYLFSRLGANDDIVGGQSTFMVEMSETASILRHATSRSLIILDEVGRGTSTYDGMSIAWALVEFFVRRTKALCLFSTHYHELTELVERLDGAVNLTVETVTRKGEVKFLYRLIEGAAQESFGLYVAKLAGLPRPVLQRSEEILRQLEGGPSEQLSLFNSPPPPPASEVPPQLAQLRLEIEQLEIPQMTPMQALQKLQQWQSDLESRP